jgi:histone deacetylase complex regulatory component SIN3
MGQGLNTYLPSGYTNYKSSLSNQCDLVKGFFETDCWPQMQEQKQAARMAAWLRSTTG